MTTNPKEFFECGEIQIPILATTGAFRAFTLEQIQQFALAMWNKGMTDAADIASYNAFGSEDEHYKAAHEHTEQAILTARDEKKEI